MLAETPANCVLISTLNVFNADWGKPNYVHLDSESTQAEVPAKNVPPSMLNVLHVLMDYVLPAIVGLASQLLEMPVNPAPPTAPAAPVRNVFTVLEGMDSMKSKPAVKIAPPSTLNVLLASVASARLVLTDSESTGQAMLVSLVPLLVFLATAASAQNVNHNMDSVLQGIVVGLALPLMLTVLNATVTFVIVVNLASSWKGRGTLVSLAPQLMLIVGHAVMVCAYHALMGSLSHLMAVPVLPVLYWRDVCNASTSKEA